MYVICTFDAWASARPSRQRNADQGTEPSHVLLTAVRRFRPFHRQVSYFSKKLPMTALLDQVKVCDAGVELL